MTLVLDTRTVAAEVRGDLVRETIAATVVPVHIDFPAPSGPAVRGAISDFGHLRVCSIRSNATKVERTPRLARDALTPSIFLGLQLEGSSLIVQDGREVVLDQGNLAFSISTSPYTLIDGSGVRQHFFSIPVAALALSHDAVRRLAAVSLSPGHPITDLTRAYLGRLAARPRSYSSVAAGAVGRPSVELVRALITTHLDAAALTTDSLDTTLQLRLVEYIRWHLHEPGLNAAQIAAAHHISVRHLYNVLAASNISLGDWIRGQRLEACRDELRRPASHHLTIAAIAHRWGFRDSSSFGRVFRSTYGLTPRAWRNLGARTYHPTVPTHTSRSRPWPFTTP